MTATELREIIKYRGTRAAFEAIEDPDHWPTLYSVLVEDPDNIDEALRALAHDEAL